MIKMPDGIVTVHLDGERYRGADYFRGEELIVTAYGLKKSSVGLNRKMLSELAICDEAAFDKIVELAKA